MASYHLSAQPVKRSEGRSVVAMAAYRAGVLLNDERRGNDVDYRRRRGVVHAEILAPDDAADWLLDRESLWNAVERMEVRRDAQLAREINMALPHELTDAQRLDLVRSFVREYFVSLGMVADFAIHAPVAEKGDDPRNHHVHVLLTMRQAGGGGLRRVKTREWNSEVMLAAWRKAWAEKQNRALGRAGHRARVDHRSLAAQRAVALDRGDREMAAALLREPEIHIGPKASKASVARAPVSQVRRVGPKRKTGVSLVPVRRERQYPSSDRGSRIEWMMRRLGRNALRFEKVVAKAERQMARFRQRQVYYASLAREPDRVEPVGLQARQARRAHARKRLLEIAYWLTELDLLFFALLHIRESQLVRRTVWSNRLVRALEHGAMRARRRPWMPG
ncbi:MobQ family relaxase [Bradyrhizobium japonicum]|uniref:MobQ family relaxase n=1 Tax=Bradyrhizobium japonicum TaxID=375 RepID=UPI0027148AF8|nr:MobQ family relaxase [Bradyrhizobium japonicum]WLB57445.1 MobQ family relaxase [Bradyrhizobium japonicum]